MIRQHAIDPMHNLYLGTAKCIDLLGPAECDGLLYHMALDVFLTKIVQSLMV